MYESYWLRTTQMERKSTKTISDTEKQAEEAPTDMASSFKPKTITAEDWRKMSLMDKWKTSYREDYNDSSTSKRAGILGCCLFLYTAVTVEYVVTAFMIDELFSEYSDMTRYYLRVFFTFVFIQLMANWLCTVCYKSDLRETRDNPDIDKLLWDEHPTENGQRSEITVEDCNSDRTGLTWKWCDLCKMEQPPRTHHCKICQKCILKRDHHCFFTATCIGFYNQRYFVFLNFYLALGCAIYFPCLICYMQINYAPNSTWSDYFLPLTLYNWFLGELELKYVILVSHYYCAWWPGLMAFGFFCTQMYSITQGLTSNEVYKKRSIRSTASVSDNFRDVFGTCWLFNFIFPTVILFRQEGDGKHWTDIKKV